MPNQPALRRPAAAVAVFVAATALAASTPAQEPEKVEVPVEDAAMTSVQVEHKRVPLPSLSQGVNQPYTIEVPVNWEVRRDLAAVGVFLGPPGGDPNSHPEMLLLRESDVGLGDPESILANLRANAESADWSLRQGEVRDFGGEEGLWIVRGMPPLGMHGERVSYAVKLPLGERSLDVLATVPVEREAVLAPGIRHMLLSIRPADEAPTEPEE